MTLGAVVVVVSVAPGIARMIAPHDEFSSSSSVYDSHMRVYHIISHDIFKIHDIDTDLYPVLTGDTLLTSKRETLHKVATRTRSRRTTPISKKGHLLNLFII